ncbi:MAG: hypothetical protein M0042_06505 [Nitrospiraceae bacterium]|nr:hypothetical protein [Nitrospiraceae bacterium]
MSILPDNKSTLVIAIAVFVAAILFSTFGPKRATHEVNTAGVHESTQRNLSPEQAISLANQEAVRKGFDLSQYEKPRADYEILKKDKTWTVSYEGKKKLPGNHFLVWVNDQTGECKLMPGE